MEIGDVGDVGCRIPPKRAVGEVWIQPKRRKHVAVNKAEGVRDLKSTFTTDMKMQSSVFSKLIFNLVLVQ